MSGAVIQNNWNPLTVLLNTLIPNVYFWKSKAENHLRASGLNYAIVRPTLLKGEEKDTTVTPYKISQGGQWGKITRCTVAKVMLDVVKCK